jgi:hypothetical protein
MAQTGINEVEVLRYFEQEPLDRANLLFNIVQDKMRTRLQGDGALPSSTSPKKRRSNAAKSDGEQPEISDAHSG